MKRYKGEKKFFGVLLLVLILAAVLAIPAAAAPLHVNWNSAPNAGGGTLPRYQIYLGCVTDLAHPAPYYFWYSIDFGAVEVDDNFYVPLGSFVRVEGFGYTGGPITWNDIYPLLEPNDPLNPCGNMTNR